MTISGNDISLFISLSALLVSIFFNFRGGKRADTHEVERKAAETATINTKLDQIGGDVRDIKYDITAVRKDVTGLKERMIVVEQSTKSAHRRLDENFGKQED